MRLLYPSDPLSPRRVDEAYSEEHEAATAAGIAISLFSLEDFENGVLVPKPVPRQGERVLYRGWMLTVERYSRLTRAINDCGAMPFTQPDLYALCHYLPRWYALLSEFTPETIVLAEGEDYAAALSGLAWPGFFVKDFVKSLTTGPGSLVRSPADVTRVVSLMKHYRGFIEGGICIRRWEEFVSGTERRFFVLNGRAFGADGVIPTAVIASAQRVGSPFFSVDVAERADGVVRIVELGDGQVSDRKQWGAKAFADLLVMAA